MGNSNSKFKSLKNKCKTCLCILIQLLGDMRSFKGMQILAKGSKH